MTLKATRSCLAVEGSRGPRAQTSAGDGRGCGMAHARYIENVFEELDSGNEYYYNSSQQVLYYAFNGTGLPPPSLQFVAANLSQLIVLRGSQVSLLDIF
jgi:hypothetical protein